MFQEHFELNFIRCGTVFVNSASALYRESRYRKRITIVSISYEFLGTPLDQPQFRVTFKTKRGRCLALEAPRQSHALTRGNVTFGSFK